MYIDTSSTNRICLNAQEADSAKKLSKAVTIQISGSVSGSATFDGSTSITIATTTNHTHNYAGSTSAGGDANRAVKVKDSVDGKDIFITYSKAGQNSTSWLASWNDHELGRISPSKVTVGKATSLANSPTIALTGAVTGSKTFTGDTGISINTTVNRVDKNADFRDDTVGGLSYYDSVISNTTNNESWSAPEKGWY